MKKILKAFCALSLVLAIAVAALSCGRGGGTETTASTSESSTSSDTSGSTSASENVGGSDINNSALELLKSIWSLYSEDEKFYAIGGDMDNLSYDGPGAYSLEDAEALKGALSFPKELIGKIDSAASLVHGINTNNFTCGVFRFKDASEISGAITSMKKSILSTQWICGFPNHFFIITVPGNYVISIWGNIDENMDYITEFKNKVIDNISGAAVAVSEPIV